MKTTVERAGAADRPLIEGLFQFYVYDFAEMEPAESDRFDVAADGLYEAYPYLPLYWSEPGYRPHVIRVEGRPAGFALVNHHSHLDGGHIGNGVAEFFVARKYRRVGAGRAAVAALLAMYPGEWEAAVAERNTTARAFWPRALEAGGGRDLTELQGDGEHWTGPIYRCRV